MARAGIPRRAALGLVAASLGAVRASRAQQPWPSGPVRIVSPFPPGGMVDVLARAIAPGLSARLGQPVVVENRPGANGNIGAEAVARAAPDGQVLLASSLGPIATNQYIYRTMPYDTDTAFAPVVLLARTPKVMCVAKARPWRSVQEVVAAAKAQPGVLTAGSAGNGSSLHIALELFKRATGTDIRHVPYRGVAPAVTDLVAGQIDLMIDNLPNIIGQLAAGQVRAVAVATERRLPRSSRRCRPCGRRGWTSSSAPPSAWSRPPARRSRSSRASPRW
jgi:tripartite-type tricarboxylate transporter receptor subunit TctC